MHVDIQCTVWWKNYSFPTELSWHLCKKIKWYKCEGMCLESQFSSIDLHVQPYTLFWFLQVCCYILNFRSARSSTISYSWTVKVKSLTSPTSQKNYIYIRLFHILRVRVASKNSNIAIGGFVEFLYHNKITQSYYIETVCIPPEIFSEKMLSFNLVNIYH